ncbi:hypothetical protein AVEN_149174-1 [Araneus ventricosus]|uniref:Deoxyuridine 5'-triphosphate nucleotidohydrolase n=1 Tax=Araneus ventricosus TaxID=182803 RepID=A0A4Y2TC32_ARAVE|nr:hypothetical protein AVEN_149174-1 [Araneus ventricosus]
MTNIAVVKFARTFPGAYIPELHTAGSVGYDLRTPISFSIEPESSIKINVGIAFEIDEDCNFYPQIFDKSSVAANYNVNAKGGVIDIDYRGSIIVALVNHSKMVVNFKRGDGIAQLVFLNYTKCKLLEVEFVKVDTERAKRGFGGTTHT